MIWRIGSALDPIQEMTGRLNQTSMARYIEPTLSLLSMTKRSMYIKKDGPEQAEDRVHIVPGQSGYLFVCPLQRTPERTDKEIIRLAPHHVPPLLFLPIGKA